ncbi:MAG: L,D-transpeptidase, partial [Candidatus Cloacimonetes bacterium]|nr:L,D-transpeptidase [Candidatus Cloacimonadota bacterium]
GGEIGIHGVPAGYDNMIDEKYNWTLGCISLKNVDVNEIYKLIKVGTRIEIRH